MIIHHLYWSSTLLGFLSFYVVVNNQRNKNYHTLATLNRITHWKNYSWRAHVRVGETEGDPEGDGRRTLANGWESRLWRLGDKRLREGSSVRQFGRPRPLRIRHRRRRNNPTIYLSIYLSIYLYHYLSVYMFIPLSSI